MVPLLLLLAALSSADGARILAFFPFPPRSHHFVFRPVIEELAKRGHDIHYVTTFPYQGPPKGITQIDISSHLPKSSGSFSWLGLGELSVPMVVTALYEIGLMLAPSFLGNPEVQRLIHSDQKFDAVMFESYFVQEYLSPLIHKFDAVGVEIMPLGDCAWVNELSGLPNNPSYQLDYKKEHTNDLNLWHKLHNLYVQTTLTVLGYFYLFRQQTVADTYFNYTGWEGRPPLYRMVSNRSVVLVNSHFAVGYPSPGAPHRVEIGGINVKPSKPLPKTESRNPFKVVYANTGSAVSKSNLLHVIRGHNKLNNFISILAFVPLLIFH